MTTRFNTRSKNRFGQPPLQSGYEKTASTPDLFIPSCGIEDVDVSLFNLFDKEIVAQFGGTDNSELKKVPVVFAAGEKWALLKGGRPLRDKNNTLLLPLITIMRTDLNQTSSEDIVGRGINQQTGELVVKRRLDSSDRDYQRLINRLMIPNQNGLSESTASSSLKTERATGVLSQTKDAKNGALLVPNLTNNVYETIVVPSPQFYTAKYQVTIWTQYTQHANQILEKIFSSFLPQGQSWRLDTAKGYWFIAKVEDGSFAIETNFDDMSQQERYIKHTFNVSVPAYFFVPSSPGSPIAIKKYVSVPTVSFETGFDNPISLKEEEDSYVLGSDDPTIPLDEQPNRKLDQQADGWRQQKIYPVFSSISDSSNLRRQYSDPVASSESQSSNSATEGSVKVIGKTSKGETVYSGRSLEGLEIIFTK
jgi:hypothetical protein